MGIAYARTSGNRIIILGTSISQVGAGSTVFDPSGAFRGSSNWFGWGCFLSNQQMIWQWDAAKLGDTTDGAIARFNSDIVPFANNFEICIIEQGTNDAYVQLRSVKSFAANIKTLVGMVQALNKVPVLCTVMQRSDLGSLLVEQYNSFLYEYCLLQGIPLIDFYSAVLNTATGLTNVANTSDGLHPSPAGARLMGQASVTKLAPILLSLPVMLAAEHQQAWSNNLVANSLGTNNAAGLFTGFVKAGTGTPTIVAPSGSVIGNWQRLTATDATQTSINSAAIISGWAPGDIIAVSAWLQSNTIGGGLEFQVIAFNSGLSVTPVALFTGVMGPNACYAEWPIPAGSISLFAYLVLPAGASVGDWVQYAQPSIVNLSTLGTLL